MENEVITVTEAATIMGVHDTHVRLLIRQGKIPATRHGGIWILKRADVEGFEKSPRGRPTEKPVGRPRKARK